MVAGLFWIDPAGRQSEADDVFVNYCGKDSYLMEREVWHMRDFYLEKKHERFDQSGLFSPKFSGKTQITGFQFASFIRKNPDHDVYLINPPDYFIFPYMFYNIWEHGEACHPGLYEKTNRLLAKAGYDFDVSNMPRMKGIHQTFCNYWAGTPSFWEGYMQFLAPLMAVVDHDKNADGEFYKLTKYQDGSFCFIPFIFERLLSTYLLLNPSIKAITQPYTINIANPDVIESIKEIDQLDMIGAAKSEFVTAQNKLRQVLNGNKMMR